MPKVQTRLSPRRSTMLGYRRFAAVLPIAIALAVSGCVTSGPIIAEAGNCSGYIPGAWREPVPGADLPESNSVGDWISFADREAAQLDKANGRMADTLHIVGECERRATAAVKRSRPRFLGIL